MNKSQRAVLSLGGFALLFISALALAKHGRYGWTLFIMLPFSAGALGTWVFRPSTAPRAQGIGALIGCAGSALFLLVGAEGYICALMALPVVAALTSIGGLLAYWTGSALKSRPPVAMALLLPLTPFFDVNARPPVFAVTTSIVVQAPPERVWKYVTAFPEIMAKPDWVLRTGLAYPIRTRIEGSGVGAPRSCDLSTGSVRERVVAWDEPRLLRFVVTSTPPAMRERGLYGPIYPKHLDGYYISKQGQFALTPLPGGRTLVVGTSWYQHGLWPAAYWRLWSDAVVHHIHRRVLEHIKMLSESDQ